MPRHRDAEILHLADLTPAQHWDGGRLVPPETWCRNSVRCWLEQGADTLSRLRVDSWRAQLLGGSTSWPVPLHEVVEAYGWTPVQARPAAPSPDAIDNLHRVLEWGWLGMVPRDWARLMWACASRIPVARIRRRYPQYAGLHRNTIRARYERGLSRIAGRMNRP